MADIELRIKSGPTIKVSIDRVPTATDYISVNNQLLKVVAVVFIPAPHAVNAVVFAEKDSDGKPDALGLMPAPF
jgi:hypothetical protein